MRLPIFALAALAYGLTGPAAQAVDLPPAPVLDDEEESLGSGWYLRGDAGGADTVISRRSRDGGDNLSTLINGQLDWAPVVGAGLGYRVSPWFRADVTIDHRFAQPFRGTRFAAGRIDALDRAEVDATTFLVNGYVDLPLWNGITPYLGAGIGVSRLHIGEVERDGGGPTGVPVLPTQTETVLAWALMGGVAFDLTANLKIDFGYRYIHLDSGGLGGWNDPFRPRHLNAHEFRVGARYLLD